MTPLKPLLFLDEDGKKIFRPETQLPDRRQLRIGNVYKLEAVE